MVLDLGRDYYHMSPPELDHLRDKIQAGDMEEVLRVYEKELQVGVVDTLADIQSPVKNALMGSLIRTLLIQVQKTKVSGQFWMHFTPSSSQDRPVAVIAVTRPSAAISTANLCLCWSCPIRLGALWSWRMASRCMARRETRKGQKESLL